MTKIKYNEDDVELVETEGIFEPKCHYCALELDDGATFAGDNHIPDRYYCMECLEEYWDEIEANQSKDPGTLMWLDRSSD